MEISGINLKGFSTEKPFNSLNDFKFGGVYFIIKLLPNGKKEIVKIGESNFIYRRLANYLTPFKSKEEEKQKNRKTKKTIHDNLTKGAKEGCVFSVIWRIVEDKQERKALEKWLISDFKKANGNRPVMNNSDR